MFKFSKSSNITKPCYVEEILKYSFTPDMISFAEGNPNPATFPLKELQEATNSIFKKTDGKIFQYSTSEGELLLRKFLAKRYQEKYDFACSSENIIITNGSQQGFDLICQIFLNPNDKVIMEKPGYLGAIQTLQKHRANIHQITLQNDGIKLDELVDCIADKKPKFVYGVTNFSNPSGITYSYKNRCAIARTIKDEGILFVEDDPYFDLNYDNFKIPAMKKLLGDFCIHLGSFSKILTPAMRLGWVCASNKIIQRLNVMKQATDIHTNSFVQNIVLQYLNDYSLEEHIQNIVKLYRLKRDLMYNELQKKLPKEFKFNKPNGGMFLWVETPPTINILKLFKHALKNHVLFVPGYPFFTSSEKHSNFRLNFTNSSEINIILGVDRLLSSILECI